MTVLEADLVGVPVRTEGLPQPAPTFQRQSPSLTGSLISHLLYIFLWSAEISTITGKSTGQIPNTIKSPPRLKKTLGAKSFFKNWRNLEIMQIQLTENRAAAVSKPGDRGFLSVCL